MKISGHAVIRYLERVEGAEFGRERAIAAAELGFVSPNAIADGNFFGWLRDAGVIDVEAARARCAIAIQSGEIHFISRGDIVVTVFGRERERAPFVPTRDICPWHDPVSRQTRRRILIERTFSDETYRVVSPRKRRSRSRTAAL